jgi:hypothetical protein
MVAFVSRSIVGGGQVVVAPRPCCITRPCGRDGGVDG